MSSDDETHSQDHEPIGSPTGTGSSVNSCEECWISKAASSVQWDTLLALDHKQGREMETGCTLGLRC